MLCYVRPGHLEALLVELPAPHAKVVRQFKGEDTLRNDAHTPLVRVGVWVVVVAWGRIKEWLMLKQKETKSNWVNPSD